MSRRIAAIALNLFATTFADRAHAAQVASSTACSPDAIAQARKLLGFHLGSEEDGIHSDDKAKPLSSIVNPASSKQRLDVLEVWGYLYKGQYRMRFEYFCLADGECVLMGQEILEHAAL